MQVPKQNAKYFLFSKNVAVNPLVPSHHTEGDHLIPPVWVIQNLSVTVAAQTALPLSRACHLLCPVLALKLAEQTAGSPKSWGFHT